jgi:hypothetical protein
MKDYQRSWNEFWKPLCTKSGKVNLDAVKRELHDYRMVLREVPKVYDHVTRGRICKANTLAREVIAVADDVRNEEINEAIKEHVEGALA